MTRPVLLFTLMLTAAGTGYGQDTLPFSYRVETFQHEDDSDVRAFVVRLEQPFLAEEFEKSNYLRLKASDNNAFLIYPRETKFAQKHAEFYGRLRGEGKTSLLLSYETISENPDGSRRVNSRQTKIEIDIPATTTGSDAVYRSWARKQNEHFARLLEYYPNESFFEYLLLQSEARYGVKAPNLSRLMPDRAASEEGLYRLFSTGLDVQSALQISSIRAPVKPGDHTIHISQVAEPEIKSQDYEALLDQRLEDGHAEKADALAGLIPHDQYFLKVNSWDAAVNMRNAFEDWVEQLGRLFREDAQDHHLWEKYEGQLLLNYAGLEPLFEAGEIGGLAVTGSDFFVAEGTDLSVVFQTNGKNGLQEKVNEWAAQAKENRPEMEDREFNYRGLKIRARYTADRKISSFVVATENALIVSSSHVGIRRIVDTLQERIPSLASADDYRYMSTLLPADDEPDAGYFYCSDAFLRYLFSPSFKVGERRRKQSHTNLVMLNNASLFHRLEYGRSPQSLTQLIEGRFVDPDKIVCPQGGAYSFDVDQDTSTSSVFNRIKYLTPIRELKVLKISVQEQQEYQRYQKRLASFWQKYFTPVALRFSTKDSLKVDYCLLPFGGVSEWNSLKGLLNEESTEFSLGKVAESVFASVNMKAGRRQISSMLRSLPGVEGVLRDDPTLTDLAWLGERMSLNFCDSHTVLEVDPTRIRNLNLPFAMGLPEQTAVAASLFAAAAPIYVSIDIEDEEKADRFLQMLSSRIFLHQQNLGEIGTEIDAYQLPDHKEHPVFVVSYRVYVARIRFYVSVVGDKLIAATEPHVLHQVIDAAQADQVDTTASGQLAVRLNTTAMKKLKDDLRIYWDERSRRASNRNIMPIYTLLHLYGVSVDEVDAISDAKYGVTYYCPEGEYRYDAERDRVYSTAFGNREQAWQKIPNAADSGFERAFARLKEILFSIKVSEESIQGTLQIQTNQ